MVKKKAARQSSSKRRLIPRGEFQNVFAQDVVRIPQGPGLELSSRPYFPDEDEARYFHFYCTEIAGQISGFFMTSVWNQLIPQTANLDPIIRHAIVAIGALGKSRLDSSLLEQGTSPVSKPHLQRALQHYGRALKGMRDSSRNSEKTLRHTLIACLLFFCLETMQGQTMTATAHASNGANLLHRQGIQHHLPRNNLTHYAQKLNIEEDLVSAFGSLDLQALVFLDNRPAPVHRSYQASLEEAIESMPDTLSSVKICHTYWQLIHRRNLHVISAIREEIDSDTPACGITMESLLTKSFVETQPGNNIWCHSGKPTPYISDATRKELQRCRDDITRWSIASRFVIEPYISKPEKTEECFLAMVLVIQAANNIVTLASTLFPLETEYDVLMPEFRTITHLASLLHDLSQSATTFQFPIAIVPGLTEVGLRCRDKKVRDQAIELLLARPGYQEGLWPCMELGRFLCLVRQIEEQGMDENGYIPAASRVSWTATRVSMEERKTEIDFVQGSGWGEVEFVRKTKVMNW